MFSSARRNEFTIEGAEDTEGTCGSLNKNNRRDTETRRSLEKIKNKNITRRLLKPTDGSEPKLVITPFISSVSSVTSVVNFQTQPG